MPDESGARHHDDPPIFAVITGGGTAGHVWPAIAVAESLVRPDRSMAAMHYVGAKRGIETRLIPPTGVDHTFLDVTGVQRGRSRDALRANSGVLPRMWRARREAISLLRRLEPRVVVSVGGYASLPAVLAARRLNIPVVVISYDRIPGRASRLSARWAAACAVAFEDSVLPRAVVTGAPLRQAILDVDRERDRSTARSRLAIADDRFVILVMGGSQGSGVLNTAVIEMVSDRDDDRGLAIRHVLGERFVDQAPPPRSGADGLLYQPVGFDPDMATSYAAADLVIGRGGASTVHEVAATGSCSILVPWAASAEDHQRHNVDWLASVGGAMLLPEAEIGQLVALVDRLRSDPQERHRISEAAYRRGEVHRHGGVARLIESVALA